MFASTQDIVLVTGFPESLQRLSHFLLFKKTRDLFTIVNFQYELLYDSDYI